MRAVAAAGHHETVARLVGLYPAFIVMHVDDAFQRERVGRFLDDDEGGVDDDGEDDHSVASTATTASTGIT